VNGENFKWVEHIYMELAPLHLVVEKTYIEPTTKGVSLENLFGLIALTKLSIDGRVKTCN
jgi:hypothetical protein